jgi:uncharacterized protein YukJ
MALMSYGVLRAQAVERRREDAEQDTPHYQVHLVDSTGRHFRSSVNVKSKESPSELLYLCDAQFSHPLLSELLDLSPGWTPVASVPGGVALDFVRGNLFDPTLMRLLPASAQGPDNDLADALDHYVLRATADERADVFIFGEPWAEPGIPDKIFGFEQGAGVHDVHMNQGNDPEFAGDDGVWQDGGLLVHFAEPEQWVAVFLAFQSQAWHTDDHSGHSLGDVGDVGPRPGGLGPHVRVVGALVNAAGDEVGQETVTLINTTPDPIALDGWRLADRAKNTCRIEGVLGPGEARRFQIVAPCTLGNSGGLITLLNADGLKMDGVAYTGRDAAEGWTVIF